MENQVPGKKNSSKIRSYRWLTRLLCLATAVLPILSIVGWLMGIPLLSSFSSQFIPMAPSTAISFLLLAVILCFQLGPDKKNIPAIAFQIVSSLVAIYGLLVLLGSLTGLPINPDNWIFHSAGIVAGYSIGVMSPSTGLLFIFSGMALLLITSPPKAEITDTPWYLRSSLWSGIVFVAGLIFLLAYLIGLPLLYGSSFIPMAITTSISFVLLGVTLLIVSSQAGSSPLDLFRLFKDTRISILLAAGLGLILTLVLILGLMAYLQAGRIWEQTQGLYNHPLQIRRAVGDFTLDMFNIRLHMDDLISTTDGSDYETLIIAINKEEIDAEGQLAIISAQYLGPHSDVEALIDSFTAWKVSRDETIQLVRDQNLLEAQQRLNPGGATFILLQETLSDLNSISEYAANRGDKFYQDALTQFKALRSRLTIILIFIGILSLITSYILIRSIRTPLKELIQVSQRFQGGDYDARSHIVSGNEFGLLSASLDHQADVIQADLLNKKKVLTLTSSMLLEDDLQAFSQNMLDQLLQLTGSHMGALYLLNSDRMQYEHFCSIGLDAAGQSPFSATSFDGEFGKALLLGEIQHIRDIPPHSLFKLRTVSADLKPSDIITLPLKIGEEIPAVISLASLQPYSPGSLSFLQEVQNLLSARLNGILSNEQVHRFSAILETQNLELQARQKEQQMLTKELNEQNMELEQQKKQLDQVNQMKSTFISNMSHELRTPLNSIIALSGVLSRRLKGTMEDEEYSYLEVIERNGRNLLNLINDILDISRLEAGKQVVSLSRFSIFELVGEVTELVLPQAIQKQIDLVNSVPENLPSMFSDRSLCTHIIQNLVANAVKFTESGKVDVSGFLEGDNIRIEVVDTGIGIPADQLPYIFEEFRQGDEGNARKYGGTGLGLSIAMRYTQLLKGSLHVHSLPDRGSTFTLLLPLRLDPEAFEEDQLDGDSWNQPPARVKVDDRENGKRSILLVDDNEPALIQMTDMLSEKGFALRVARNGQEALDQVKASLPDAIILDLMMPKMDGFEVLQRIRGTERTSALPVLILTSKHISKDELKFLKKNNVHQLIQKGNISRKELLDAVGKMVNPVAEIPENIPVSPTRKNPGDELLILAVEDNPDNMLAVRSFLKDTCQLLEARDGLAGVNLARLHIPDLILMDISLPAMDGIQALQVLRADPNLAGIPVVALTASAMKGSREEILAYGFNAYLSKPVDPESLLNTIQEVLFGR